MFCRQQVAELEKYADRFDASGAALVVIGNGKPEHIGDFISHTGYSGTIMTDPELRIFTALGFTRKLSGILSPSTLVGGLKALKGGYRQADIQGDALQLGGAVVVGPGAVLFYYYRSERAEEHPPIEQILEACTTEIVFPM